MSAVDTAVSREWLFLLRKYREAYAAARGHYPSRQPDISHRQLAWWEVRRAVAVLIANDVAALMAPSDEEIAMFRAVDARGRALQRMARARPDADGGS